MRFPSHDLFSKQSRRAGPVWDPWKEPWHELPDQIALATKSVRLELHQHLSGYEPGALMLSYRPENGGPPRPRTGYDLDCKQAPRLLRHVVLDEKTWVDRRALHPLRDRHRVECYYYTTVNIVRLGSRMLPPRNGRWSRNCADLGGFSVHCTSLYAIQRL